MLPSLACPGIAFQTFAAELRNERVWDACGFLSKVDSVLLELSFTPWLLHRGFAVVAQPPTETR